MKKNETQENEEKDDICLHKDGQLAFTISHYSIVEVVKQVK